MSIPMVSEPFRGYPEAPELRGLTEVRVDRADLLKKVEENAANHRKIFEEAIDGMDRWGWKHQFMTSSASYGSTTAAVQNKKGKN